LQCNFGHGSGFLAVSMPQYSCAAAALTWTTKEKREKKSNDYQH